MRLLEASMVESRIFPKEEPSPQVMTFGVDTFIYTYNPLLIEINFPHYTLTPIALIPILWATYDKQCF